MAKSWSVVERERKDADITAITMVVAKMGRLNSSFSEVGLAFLAISQSSGDSRRC